MRKPSLRAALLALTVSTGLVCSTAPVVAQSQQAEVSYTQEELITGIVFGVGPVASKLKLQTVNQIPSEVADSPEYQTAVSEIAEAVIQDKSDELSPAIDALHSGDPYEVEQAINKINRLTAEVTKARYSDKLPDQEITPQCGPFMVCFAGQYLAIALQFAIVVVAWLEFGGYTAVVGHTGIYDQVQTWGQNQIEIPRDSAMEIAKAKSPYPEELTLKQAELVKRVTVGLKDS